MFSIHILFPPLLSLSFSTHTLEACGASCCCCSLLDTLGLRISMGERDTHTLPSLPCMYVCVLCACISMPPWHPHTPHPSFPQAVSHIKARWDGKIRSGYTTAPLFSIFPPPFLSPPTLPSPSFHCTHIHTQLYPSILGLSYLFVVIVWRSLSPPLFLLHHDSRRRRFLHYPHSLLPIRTLTG